jgi:hypothetical protein
VIGRGIGGESNPARRGNREDMSDQREDSQPDTAAPSGLPPGAPEEGPLGVDEEEGPRRGEKAMPGIPTEGGPPDAG